jgi:flagellar protein FlgJ
MTPSIGPAPVTPTPTPTPLSKDEARLRKTAVQLEGLFVQRMFAAMRDTVPQDGGMVSQSSAEGTFTQMLDEKMSEQVPQQWDGPHSLAQALYHQLRQRLPSPADSTASTGSAGSTGSEPR